MFGTFRTVLALFVVAQHLGSVPSLGAFAVFGFYILSGYLMTLVMQRTYGYSVIGFGRYIANRALRIYPLYLASVALTIILLWLFQEPALQAFKRAMVWPTGAAEWFANVFIFFPYGTDLFFGARLTPPAWALTVELFYYLLIGVGATRHRWLSWFGLLSGAFYHMASVALGWDWNMRYFTIQAAIMPFFAGALLYHYRQSLQLVMPGPVVTHAGALAVIGMGLVLVNWVTGGLLGGLHDWAFYTNFCLFILIVALLSIAKSLPLISKQADQRLGDFSYPVYLIHYQVGFVVLMAGLEVGVEWERDSLVFCLVATPFVMGVAWCLMKAIELPLERVRTRVRNQ